MALNGGTVLVLRALGLGDLLTGVPALRGLRLAHPDSRIVLAAPRPLEGLLPLIHAVDALWPTGGLESFRWTRPPPEVAVNLHGSGPQSLEAVRSTDAPSVLTHSHPSHPGLDGPLWMEGQHEVHRWCRLLRYYGIEADPADLLLSRPEEGANRAVVLHPGASHSARRWPEERFAEVARSFFRRGYPVVITGDAAERPIAERVAAAAGLPGDAVLAGKTGLRRLAALVADAILVVCGDTGLAHLATAYRTPSVVLFGPVPPAHWGPPDEPQHVALWTGGLGDTFSDRPDPGLLQLSVDMVLEAAETALEHRRPVHGGVQA